MTADQAPAKDGTAESLIVRVVRVVTRPGGMNIDWKRVRAAGAVIAGISVLPGEETATLGDIRRDRMRSAVQLIDEKPAATRDSLCPGAYPTAKWTAIW